jgi:hypothetical protein
MARRQTSTTSQRPEDFIVPFGKYRGQPVKTLLRDRDYVYWLVDQEWLLERYGDLWSAMRAAVKPTPQRHTDNVIPFPRSRIVRKPPPRQPNLFDGAA